jgi:hypothetical protein
VEGNNEEILLNEGTGVPSGLAGLPASRLQSLLSDAPIVAHRLLAGAVDDRADAQLVYRSTSAIMARALGDHDCDLFSSGIRSMAAMWSIGDPDAMLANRTRDLEAGLWEAITVELFAIGGLAVGRERWDEMRQIVLGGPPQKRKSDRWWLRQGQVASTRSTSYRDETVLHLAVPRMRALDPGGANDTLTAICRFDLLNALIISEEGTGGYYPNCAAFSESLVEPLVIDCLRSVASPLRQYVFAGDEAGLRKALLEFDAVARAQAAYARYGASRGQGGSNWEWRAFKDARTWSFINAGQMLEEWGVRYVAASSWRSPSVSQPRAQERPRGEPRRRCLGWRVAGFSQATRRGRGGLRWRGSCLLRGSRPTPSRQRRARLTCPLRAPRFTAACRVVRCVTAEPSPGSGATTGRPRPGTRSPRHLRGVRMS